MGTKQRKLVEQSSIIRNRMPSLQELTDSMIDDEQVVEKIVEVEKLVPAPMIVDQAQRITWIGNFGVSPRGLYVGEEVTYDEWEGFFTILDQYRNSFGLIVGDWLGCGERKWGVTYAQVAALLRVKAETLTDYVWVCNSVQLSLRKDNLTLNHYKVVAKLDFNQQEKWLNQASIGDDGKPWSADRLEAEIAGLPILPRTTEKKNQVQRFESAIWKGYQRGFKIAVKATAQERQQMADRLRQLADKIETGK